MSAESKAWMAAEQRRGRRAAMLPVGLGAAQILAAIAQVFFAAQLLSAVLLPQSRQWTAILGDAIGFAGFALMRAVIGHWAALAGFERGAAARRRLRNGVFSSLFASGPGLGGMRRHSAELAAIAIDRGRGDGRLPRTLAAGNDAGDHRSGIGRPCGIPDRLALRDHPRGSRAICPLCHGRCGNWRGRCRKTSICCTHAPAGSLSRPHPRHFHHHPCRPR